MSALIPIQTTISGYSGKPCTLFSAYDTQAQILAVAVEAEYQRARRAGCIVLTNENNRDMPREWVFTEADFADAIAAYYTLKLGVASDMRSGRLNFAERAMRANPDNAIEQDGMSEAGQKYRIAESITCVQVAALVTCAYAVKARAIEKTVEHIAHYVKVLKHGGFITV